MQLVDDGRDLFLQVAGIHSIDGKGSLPAVSFTSIKQWCGRKSRRSVVAEKVKLMLLNRNPTLVGRPLQGCDWLRRRACGRHSNFGLTNICTTMKGRLVRPCSEHRATVIHAIASAGLVGCQHAQTPEYEA